MIVNVTLKRVIGLAYRPVQEFIGGPDWINTDRFDIEGRVEGTPTQDQMLEMLRSLLADRFKLAARGGTALSDGGTLRRRSNWSHRGVRRRPDVERGCALPHDDVCGRLGQSLRRFRSN